MGQPKYPLAYLITFTCYGTRLHGSEFGSVEHGRNDITPKLVQPNEKWELFEQGIMIESAYFLDEQSAKIALSAFQETAEYRNWALIAAHSGTTHVHLVIEARQDPARVMGDMKSYASRALNRAGCDGVRGKRWAVGGYKQYLWKPDEVQRAIDYVLNGQGKSLAVYENPDIRSILAKM